MKKIISIMIAMFLLALPSNAGNIEKLLTKGHINTGAVSISVKKVNSGDKVISLNDKTPRNPASTLKIVTTPASLDVLGGDYKFTTQMFKSTNNDLYIKLGADPFLKSSDLKTLISAAKEKEIVPKNIYIDNTIFDNTEWGEGWQWDDDLNPLMPKFSAYNLDNNLMGIEITPKINNDAPTIAVKPYYPAAIMNLLITDYSGGNSIKLERNNNISPHIINATGTIAKQTVLKVPVNNPKLYFNLRLEEAIRNRKFQYYNPIKIAQLPQKNIYSVEKIEHDISEAVLAILKDSNNLVAETVYKLAGAKYTNSVGSIENSKAMLQAYFDKLGINAEDTKIVDGSGVSKNNLMTADFMTNFLLKLAKTDNFEDFKNSLPTSGEGTLKNRMLYFKDNLRAKTGTLSDTSAITGFITTRKGDDYVFCIIIQDAKTSEVDKKNIEEQILRQIYMN